MEEGDLKVPSGAGLRDAVAAQNQEAHSLLGGPQACGHKACSVLCGLLKNTSRAHTTL